MDLVALNCPKCNGEIELNENKEFGTCIHCGQKVVVKDRTREELHDEAVFDSWVAMAKKARETKNSDTMDHYADNILERDNNNVFGWLIKGSAAAFRDNFEVASASWKNALTHVKREQFIMCANAIIEDLIYLMSMTNKCGLYTTQVSLMIIRGSIQNGVPLTYSCDRIFNNYRKQLDKSIKRSELGLLSHEFTGLLVLSISLETNRDKMLDKVRSSTSIFERMLKRYDTANGDKALCYLTIHTHKKFFELLDDRLHRSLSEYNDEDVLYLERYWSAHPADLIRSSSLMLESCEAYTEGMKVWRSGKYKKKATECIEQYISKFTEPLSKRI